MLGILGGMGPAATADFFGKLTRLTPAQRDQEHLPVVICSLPQIPDRTEAILNRGPSPVSALLRSLNLLERCGASHIAIPCNTAHYWFDELQRQTALPILHIVDAVAQALRDRGMHGGTVGLLATTATIQGNIYAARLEKAGFQCLAPDQGDQVIVMQIIRDIKAGRTHDARCADAAWQVVARLADRGAKSVVLACTELPLLLAQDETGLLLDATEALARTCIRQARMKIPPH